MPLPLSRRTFLHTTGAAGAALLSPAALLAQPAGRSPNEQPVFGYVGSGIRFHELVRDATRFGPCAAVCDVDAVQRGRGVQSAREEHDRRDFPISIYNYEDYRRVLDRPDVDAVVVATPDHWHAKIAIEAMHAGKDVYCEKPMTLTIREGQQIVDAIGATGRVFQVGTQQRTEFDKRFMRAVAIVRDGRVGKVRRITCGLGDGRSSDPIPKKDPPGHLNWDKWLGPAPMTPYLATDEILQTRGYGGGHPYSRTHLYFRFWYEYAGGQVNDWGAHHVDIAMLALDKAGGPVGRVTVDPIIAEHPVPLDQRGVPTVHDQFNTATRFHVRCTFEDGAELDIRDSAPELGVRNGIFIQGESGRMFVNRGRLTGRPVEELASNPLPEGALEAIYGRPAPESHMSDFVECLKTRATPASDAASHHRIISICHAANIALRLGRKLTYDTGSEQFVGDEVANSYVDREKRRAYEIDA